MSSDDLSGDDSDLGECVCGEVPCLCVRGPGKLAGNPYAAYNSLPKRVSQPPKKTPGGIKQPKKKNSAAPKALLCGPALWPSLFAGFDGAPGSNRLSSGGVGGRRHRINAGSCAAM
jgi:hypothetical protein